VSEVILISARNHPAACVRDNSDAGKYGGKRYLAIREDAKNSLRDIGFCGIFEYALLLVFIFFSICRDSCMAGGSRKAWRNH
jgi:hypothetical protein